MTHETEAPRFLRGFLVLLFGSVLGKVAGLLREVIFAAAFGSGLVATGFKSAQSAVVVSANLVTGDLLSSAFVPTYSELRLRDRSRAADLLWAYLLSYGTGMTAVAASIFMGSHPLMNWVIPGAAPNVRALAGDFLGTLAWCIPLFGVAGIASYALASAGYYTATSLRATLQTAGLLAGTVVAVWLHSPTWLAAGFILAWLAYTAWCLGMLRRMRLLGRLESKATLSALRLVGANIRAVLPLAAIPVGVQVSIVFQRVIASHGPAALIASVDYAQTLSDSIVTLISVPLGFVGLTRFATMQDDQFAKAIGRIQRFVLVFGLPLSFALLPLTGTLVQVVYRRGSFDATAAALTTEVAFGMFCGVAVQILGYAFTRALTARRRNMAVLRVTLAALGAQVAVQLLSLPLHAPVLIGVGLSTYGLVLTVLSLRLLGLWRQAARLVLSATPAIGVSIAVLLLPDVPPLVALGVVLAAWAVNSALAPSLRAAAAEALATARVGRRRVQVQAEVLTAPRA